MSNKDKRFKVRFSFKSMAMGSRSKTHKKNAPQNLANQVPPPPPPSFMKYSHSSDASSSDHMHSGAGGYAIARSETDIISRSTAAYVPRNQSYMPTFSSAHHAASARTVLTKQMSRSLPGPNTSTNALLSNTSSSDALFPSSSSSFTDTALQHSRFSPSSPKFNALMPSHPSASATSTSTSETPVSPSSCMSQLPSFSFPFSAPQLFVNQTPDMYKNVEYSGGNDEFQHLLFDEQGVHDKVVIPINIDIEQVYNSEYDNNYNRKLLGPLRPVRFPIVVQCELEHKKQQQHVEVVNAAGGGGGDARFAHMESVEEDLNNNDDDDDDDFSDEDNEHALGSSKASEVLGFDLKRTNAVAIGNTMSVTQPPRLSKNMRSVSNPLLLPVSFSEPKPMTKKTAQDDTTTTTTTTNTAASKRLSSRQQLVQRSMDNHDKHKRQSKLTHSNSNPHRNPRNSRTNHSKSAVSPRHKVRVHRQRSTTTSTSSKQERVRMKFENKYHKQTTTSRITCDELEILARKLIHAKSTAASISAQQASATAGATTARRMRSTYTRQQSHAYKHPKSKLKREQHRHLLQSKVFHKSENVQFGLQLMHSIRAVTTKLAQLMETFSDGLNDLLGMCQEFMTLIVDPLSRQTYNDFGQHIADYESLVRVIDAMSSNFFDSSQNLHDNIPLITAVLQNEISTRADEYTQYMRDMRSADLDLTSLHVHCDRTLRRLFREIPKTNGAAAADNVGDDDSKSVSFDDNDEDDDLSMSFDDDDDDDAVMMRNGHMHGGLPRKKSLIQHKHIRVFGAHYVAANSNEHICREVPSQVRAEILGKYIHYVSLMEVMNANVQRCYTQVLPAVNVEFEDSEKELKTHIRSNLSVIGQNIAAFGIRGDTAAPASTVVIVSDDKFHRFNAKKPTMQFVSDSKRKTHARKSTLANVKLFSVHSNRLMASPMHVQHVVAKIKEYVSEEHEKKSHDEHTIGGGKKKYKITDEIVQLFLNNRYYHLGDILYEIPDLYRAFENYLKSALCVENLYFLREIDDIYFSLHRSGQHLFDHRIAVTECRNLYARFIADDSPTQINLPFSLVKRIKKDLQRIQIIKDPISIFDKAYENVSSLIHKESLPHFYKSPYFKSWYEKKRAENEKLRKKEKKAAKKS